MFILRIIERTHSSEAPYSDLVDNYELGSSYRKIEKHQSIEFDNLLDSLFDREAAEDLHCGKDDVLAIITGDNGDSYFILNESKGAKFGEVSKASSYSYTYKNYIMTDTGKTFEKL